jgi:hypothetical protein
MHFRKGNMRQNLWLLVIGVVILETHPAHRVVALQAAPATAIVSPLTIAASTASDHFSVGSPIPVVITLTNVSRAPLSFEIDYPNAEYHLFRFSLTADGKEGPKTAFHRALTGEYLPGDPAIEAGGGSDVYTLKPGQHVQYRVDVKKLYSITQPGSYLFSVKMSANIDNKGDINTKALKLTVLR